MTKILYIWGADDEECYLECAWCGKKIKAGETAYELELEFHWQIIYGCCEDHAYKAIQRCGEEFFSCQMTKEIVKK